MDILPVTGFNTSIDDPIATGTNPLFGQWK
jgi:hypothetical protein